MSLSFGLFLGTDGNIRAGTGHVSFIPLYRDILPRVSALQAAPLRRSTDSDISGLFSQLFSSIFFLLRNHFYGRCPAGRNRHNVKISVFLCVCVSVSLSCHFNLCLNDPTKSGIESETEPGTQYQICVDSRSKNPILVECETESGSLHFSVCILKFAYSSLHIEVCI